MYIKKLKIQNESEIIREINFKKGLNLIVDNTPLINDKLTGNNVGKTTVLKLIYFCLGGNEKEIYTDNENQNSKYEYVKKYLEDNEILITLTLVDDLDDENSRELKIERNFSSGRKIHKINGKDVKTNYAKELIQLIFNNNYIDKPTFKQIISHNIRYNEKNMNNALRTLNYASGVEYENLYLYLLGFDFKKGSEKTKISKEIKEEKLFKKRLEKEKKKNAYETSINIINLEIDELNKKKEMLNINEDFEKDIENLNKIKYRINRCSSMIVRLEIRRDLILEMESELKKDIFNIDSKEVEFLYKESNKYVSNLKITFEQLLEYHNKMIVEKIEFVTKELPIIIQRIESEKNILQELLNEEKKLSQKISKSDSFKDLEVIISQLNEKYRKKGEYEKVVLQIVETERNVTRLENKLKEIDKEIHTKEFENKLKDKINKFNEYFSEISNELYGEKYMLNVNTHIDKKTNAPIYEFEINSINPNISSGKKQGEIICFDLAYMRFAENEKIPYIHFLLNDKKELMHDNQLLKIYDFVEKSNIQLIVAILKDKLPSDLIDKSAIVIELSQNDKLFRI